MGDKTGIAWTDATLSTPGSWDAAAVSARRARTATAMRMTARLKRMGQAIYRGMTPAQHGGSGLNWRKWTRVEQGPGQSAALVNVALAPHLRQQHRRTCSTTSAPCPRWRDDRLRGAGELPAAHAPRADEAGRRDADAICRTSERIDAIYRQWYSVSGSPTGSFTLGYCRMYGSGSRRSRTKWSADRAHSAPVRRCQPRVRFLSCEPLLGPINLDLGEARLRDRRLLSRAATSD